MASFFRGVTQPTPLQQAIEKATDGNQPNEDWALIMKICDHVGMHEESAKEAIKIIRKRLQINPVTSGWRTIGLTLTLLEALTKNCGKLFHLQIAQKDFLKDFKAVIAPKNTPPTAIQEQVLGMIQIWALAFRDDPDLINVEHFYEECKQQGLEFPPAEPENAIKAAVPATGTIERPTQYSRSMSQPATGTTHRENRSLSDVSSQQAAHEHTVLKQMTPEQIAKLRSELDVVQTNVQVFGEMLVTLQPGEEHPLDLDLLLELHKTCIQMQARIIDLLTQVAIDEITVDLLRYNDEFNNSLKTFENYMQERERRVGPSQVPILNQTASPPPSAIPTSQSSPTKILFCKMPVKIYHDDDADLNIVRSKTVAFIGYGNQGRAQALNLRDSGVNNIVIGNIDDDYAKQACEDGFNPVSIEEAVRQGDILMLLIPDEDQQTVWNEKIRGNLKPNSTLVVASGYNVAFKLLDIPDDMDVVMVAPRMIGAGVRDRYVQKIPYPCFVSVEKDTSGTALATCLSVACAIGATRGNGAVSSSCREEAGIDLFAEQALWPEIMAIFREGYNVLHDAGFSDEAILFDMYLSKEPAEIFERAADEGFVKQLKYHSRTSQYGQLSTMNRHDGKEIREKFRRILHDNILSGKFAEKWSNTKWAAEELAKEWQEVEKAPIAQADQRVREVIRPDRKK
ncbi:unnamed protein product [Rotaria sp. Silwood2]|nr:unnamed protein product [Rotaria sp. Silwood2]